MRIRLLALALCALLVSAPPAARGAGATLAALVEGYRQESLALDPLAATLAGEHRYDDELPNSLALGELARGLELERRYLGALAALDPAGFGPEDRITAEVFRHDRELAIEGLRYQEELLPFDADGGLPFLLARLGSGEGMQPFAGVADYERWLRRLEGFGPWVDQAIHNLRRGAAKGISLPREEVERLLPRLAALITPETASVFYRPVTRLPPGIAAADAARLRGAYAGAIRERVNPAYRRLVEFLGGEYLPEARPGIAMSDLPLGRDWYRWRLRRATTTALEPGALHALGLKEVARLEAELDQALAETQGGDRHAYLDALAADPRAYAASAEELVGRYREIAARVAARLPELVDVAVPAAGIRAPEGLPAGLVPAAGDPAPGLPPTVFLVAADDLKASPRYLLEDRYLSQVAPGTRYAWAVAARATTLPALRRALRYPAFDAGFALYAAALGRDLGLDTEPGARVASLAAALGSAAALVVDTGLHAGGWTRAAALAYLREHGAGAAAAEPVLARIVASPGLAGAGTVGALRIRELRERAERELGGRFDLRQFHRALLGGGALPLDALEHRLGGWMAAVRAQP